MGAAITASFGGVTTNRADQIDAKWSVHLSPISGPFFGVGELESSKISGCFRCQHHQWSPNLAPPAWWTM